MIVQSFPEGSQPTLDLAQKLEHVHIPSYIVWLTCNCLTMPLLKSSGPVYVPRVTRYPPSTPSSRILRSRSFNRACLSFSSFLASLSCFVSRGLSGAFAPSRSRTSPRNGSSGLLPRATLVVYICPTNRSEGGGTAECELCDGAVGTLWCRRELEREDSLGSFEELLPISNCVLCPGRA